MFRIRIEISNSSSQLIGSTPIPPSGTSTSHRLTTIDDCHGACMYALPLFATCFIWLARQLLQLFFSYFQQQFLKRLSALHFRLQRHALLLPTMFYHLYFFCMYYGLYESVYDKHIQMYTNICCCFFFLFFSKVVVLFIHLTVLFVVYCYSQVNYVQTEVSTAQSTPELIKEQTTLQEY